MKKILITIFILFGFSGTLSAADQGQMRFGVELGFSPVDLEAEKTAQELANLSGSTVTVEYDTGSLVGLGYESDGVRYSATHYVDVGDTTDYTLFSVGWLF